MSIKHFYLMGLAVTIACAAGGASGRSSTASPDRATLLTAEEIGAINLDGKTAYDAVSRLRPRWLSARGVVPFQGETDSTEYAAVFVDGRLSGRLGTLRDIPAYQVSEISYYDAGLARAKFGFRAGTGGAIEVRMKGTQ